MNFNIHGYVYKVGDLAWVITEQLTFRKGTCTSIDGIVDGVMTYHFVMDDNNQEESFNRTDLYPLLSYAEIQKSYLITPTPTQTASITPSASRTPKPTPTQSPTPSTSFMVKPNLLDTENHPWTPVNGNVTVINSKTLKFKSLSTSPTMLPKFSIVVDVNPNQIYNLNLDINQGTCNNLILKIDTDYDATLASIYYNIFRLTANDEPNNIITQYMNDSGRFTVNLETKNSTKIKIEVTLTSDSTYKKAASLNSYLTLSNLNMVSVYNIPQVTPTLTQAGPSAYDAIVLQKNPVAYWPLNSNLLDAVGNVPIELKSNATLLNDSYGNILYMAGPSSGPPWGTSLNTSFEYTNNYSLEAWVDFFDLSYFYTIFGTTSPTSGLQIDGNPTLALYGDDDYVTFEGMNLEIGTNYHIVLVVDASSNVKLYVNSVEYIGSSHVTETYNYKFIGTDAYDDGMIGYIGNPAIYNYALTSNQVLENYNAGINGYRYSQPLPMPSPTPTPSPTPSVTPSVNFSRLPLTISFSSVSNISLNFTPTSQGIVDWGDGQQSSSLNQPDEFSPYTHAYDTQGDYIVKIYGDSSNITFNSDDGLIGTDIGSALTSWGEYNFNSLQLPASIISVPSTLQPNITKLNYIFSGAINFNQDISLWDVSNITSMANMFNGAANFNQDISLWDVSNVTSMSSMFANATAFNQDISSWNTSSVTDMGLMFQNAQMFNQSLSTWDTSSVGNMTQTFYNASAFNGDISSWNTSSVTDMAFMFYNATAFNQDLSGWCVTKIPVEPNFLGTPNFSTGATAWILPKPVWGTCPA